MLRWAALFALVLLASCSKPQPPIGKWEGGYDSNGALVVARVEILASGLVKVSAPDLLGTQGATLEQMQRNRETLASELRNGWADVAPREFEFDGKTFRKPGGVAPQMVWDAKTNQMTLQFYFGTNPALPVHLRPVSEFHDNPFGAG